MIALLVWGFWAFVKVFSWIGGTSDPTNLVTRFVDVIPIYARWQAVLVVWLFCLPVFFAIHFSMLGEEIVSQTSPDDASLSDARLRWTWFGMITSRYALNVIHAAVGLLISVPLLFIVASALVSEPTISLLVIIVLLLVVLIVQQSRRGRD